MFHLGNLVQLVVAHLHQNGSLPKTRIKVGYCLVFSVQPSNASSIEPENSIGLNSVEI